jgi:hypothetical protein
MHKTKKNKNKQNIKYVKTISLKLSQGASRNGAAAVSDSQQKTAHPRRSRLELPRVSQKSPLAIPRRH